MKAAVIDIGSGSVRLFIDGKKTSVMTKLGEGLSKTGNLSERAMSRTVKVIKTFTAQANDAGAEVYAFATEALRMAENRNDILTRIKDECGISVDIISGYEEAEIAYLGAADGGTATVIDIGGASVEIVSGVDGNRDYSMSLPLGTVVLTEQAGGSSELMKVLANRGLVGYGEVPVREKVIGVGGTFTSLAAMSLGLKRYNPAKVQGYLLTQSETDRIAEDLVSLGGEHEIAEKYRVLQKERAGIITAGAIFVGELMRYLGVDAITVSEADNLDGYVKYKNLQIR